MSLNVFCTFVLCCAVSCAFEVKKAWRILSHCDLLLAFFIAGIIFSGRILKDGKSLKDFKLSESSECVQLQVE